MTGTGTPTWRERSQTIAFHVSPQQKRAWLDALAMSDMRSMEAAFLAFLSEHTGTKYLSELEVEYLRVKSEADSLYAKLGDRRMRYFVNVFKAFGGSPMDLGDFEAITAKMFRDTDDVSSVVRFRHWLALNRRMLQIEGHLRGTKPLKEPIQNAKAVAADDAPATADGDAPSEEGEGDDEEDGEDPVDDSDAAEA